MATRLIEHVQSLKKKDFKRNPLGALELTLENESFRNSSDKAIVHAVEKVYGGKVRNYRTSRLKWVQLKEVL